MSFADEYRKLRNKRLQEGKEDVTVKGNTSFSKEYSELRAKRLAETKEEEDIAPVVTRTSTKKDEEDDGFDFFQKGAFEDGYQIGDITKSILGTAADAGVGVVKGVSKMAGGIVDAGMYGVAGLADLVGADKFADAVRVKAKENVIDNEFKTMDNFLDKYSVLGRTGDAVMEGLGQVGAIILTGGAAGALGAGAVGATVATTGAMGISSFGSGMSEAYQSGATDEEAAVYGLISGVVNAGSELIFGGLGKTVKALGLSRGLTSLDDVFAQKLSGKIANHTAKSFVQYGVKASAEGVEEVLAGIGTAAGKKLTYMSDEELSKLIEDENLLEQFVVGAVTSGVAQSGLVPGMKAGSLKESIETGRDFISGNTANEQAVIDKVYNDLIAKEEAKGEKLTKREKTKLYDDVVAQMERGEISIDTIEEVLGGDSFKAYKDTVDSEDALTKEFEELGNKQNATLAEQSRYAELKQQIAEIKQNGKRNELKTQLSDTVFGMVQNDRLAESYYERGRRGQAFQADVSKYDEKQGAIVQRAIDSGILNNTRRTHEFVDIIARLSADKGVLFDFTDNAKLKESGFAIEGKQVNGFVTKDGITLNIDSPKAWQSTVGHEITHVLEGTELYGELQTALFDYAKSKGEYDSRLADLTELYKDIKDADVNKELTADLVGDYLFTDADFVNNLHANHRNVFQKIYDEVKYLLKVTTAGSKEAKQLEKVKKAFDKAYKEGGKAQTGTKYDIVALDNGNVYVKASRNVIQGKTKAEQRSDITNFFNELLDENQSLDITTINGDVLTITKDETAWKARDDYKVEDGKRVKLSDEEFAVKLRVEAHIDEVAEVSTQIGGKGDEFEHPFAKDGFTYRKAYFEDFDGQYYQITLSIGNNGTIATVYNVGKIKESALPSAKIIAGVGSKPLGKTHSDGSKPQNGEVVKHDYSLSKDSEGRELSPAVKNRFGNSKVVDENGDLKVVYHGSPSKFTVFEHSKINAHGNAHGRGFYFTDNKTLAEGYESEDGQLLKGYLNIQKPLSEEKVTMRKADVVKLVREICNAEAQSLVDDGSHDNIEEALRDTFVSNYVYTYEDGLTMESVYRQVADMIFSGAENDVDIVSELTNAGAGKQIPLEKTYELLGYDGVIYTHPDGTHEYVSLISNQFKDIGNQNPTDDPDIRRSLSKEGEAPVRGTPARDLKLETAPVRETISEMETVADNATTTPSPVDLAEIAKQGRRENMRGAYTHNGKQYLSDGSFIAEFNAVDEGLEQSKDFPIKQALKELDEAFARRVEGNYDLHASDAPGFIKVGNSLFGTKRVNALFRALENPVFSLANVRGGHEALVVTADNGRAVLMPVSASGNAYLVYEAQPVVDTAPVQDMFPDDNAPTDSYNALVERRGEILRQVQETDIDALSDAEWEALHTEYAEIEAKLAEMGEDANAVRQEGFESITDEDAPLEMDAPYAEGSKPVTADDPFYNRDIGEVGKRNVKAYMYENPEVKPFFQQEARAMLGDLNGTTKGERYYADVEYMNYSGYTSQGVWTGTKRHTTDDIAYLLDECGYTYAEIEKGLNAIIEDHGAENNAVSKRIEFMLNDRLMNGYTDIDGYQSPPNQDYINLLNEKQINEYSKESFDALMENADSFAPPVDEIAPAPVKQTAPAKEAYEAIRPKPEKEPKMARATPAEQARAEILTDEPKVEKKKGGALSKFRNLVLDKGMVFEDLSLATGNRELQARWNSIRYAEGKAQRLMEKGNAFTKSLKSIRETVESAGNTKQFYEYLYHKHNADRMTLAERYENTGNKPVFGDSVTAEVSQKAASELEAANPEFKQYAQDVYDYMTHLRELLVEGGVISNETAKLWAEMYPHYVPIRRVGDEGLNINVPLDTGRTGVNAPVKGATGGNRNILPLFDTMGQRTIQTYKAIAKNRFGVELKNLLGTTVENEMLGIDEAIDSIDTQDGLLQEGKDGNKPTFTVFENGEKVTFEITDEMYDAMKPTNDVLAATNKLANGISNFRRGVLTEYNPWFLLKNAIKDVQDVLVNSQHAAKTYAAIPKAITQMSTNGHWYQEYLENGGEQNSYFDSQTNTFEPGNKTLEVVKAVTGLNAISKANNIIERLPRLAEYIASREAGRSIDVSMLDAARVTTNFAAGGDLTKFINRNGATFLNASVQGAMQQVRNIRDAKMNGLKGWASLAAKYALAGLPAVLLNHLIWDDDEEYEELSDYVKQNYYIVGKYGDGKFVRIPKGRTVAVIQNAFEQMDNLVTGNDEVDLGTFLDLLVTNLAPNNPLDNNILSPVIDVVKNETWYGEDLVPSRLQDKPAAEQYDETTDAVSKWLGEKLNFSPYKINYLLDQYSGVIGDTFLPMVTPEAERGDNSLAGNMIAPLKDMFTTDSVLKNQNVSDFYDRKDKLATNAKASMATDEDILMSKYMNSVNAELSELYAEKRRLQNSDLPDGNKYEWVRSVQKEIDDIAKNALDSYKNVTIDGKHATVGDVQFRWYEPGEDSDAEPGWKKLDSDQITKQNKVTRKLGISAGEYWNNKEEYDFAYEKPGKYAVAKSVGGYSAYDIYRANLYDIKADKDSKGKTISGSRKEKVIDYVNGLNMDYGMRLILFKSEYNADDTYNSDIVDYLNNRSDLTYDDRVTILKELGFEVDSKGNIYW